MGRAFVVTRPWRSVGLLRSISAILVGAGLVASAATQAVVAESSSGPTVTLTTSFVDPGTQPNGLNDCNGHPTPSGAFDYKGSAPFTGDLASTDVYCGYLTYDPITQSATGEGWDTQTGTLAACGRGSFVMHQFDYHSVPTGYDPSANAFRLTFKGELEPGSGTGAFLGARGFGTAYADFGAPADPMSLQGLPNAGTYTGTVTCPHHRPRRS